MLEVLLPQLVPDRGQLGRSGEEEEEEEDEEEDEDEEEEE